MEFLHKYELYRRLVGGQWDLWIPLNEDWDPGDHTEISNEVWCSTKQGYTAPDGYYFVRTVFY